MRAVTWQGWEDVRVEDAPDPTIEEPTDAIVEITSTAICGSDLHLYEPLAPFMEAGDILGHEPMGRVVAVGDGVGQVAVGDRVVIPFNISCGEAHGSPVARAMQRTAGLLPKAIGEPLAQKAGIDRLSALRTAIDAVRRGGTLSISGVYGGALDPMPMLDLFEKGVQIRLGQAHLKRWVPEILPLLEKDEDVLGLGDFATHHLPLESAPEAYAMFQSKRDGAIKVVLEP